MEHNNDIFNSLNNEKRIMFLSESIKEIEDRLHDYTALEKAGIDTTEYNARLNYQKELLQIEKKYIVENLTEDILHDKFKPITDYAADFEKDMKNRKCSISSGIKEIDRKLNGGFIDELYIMAAPTGTGKSAIALNMAENIAAAGVNVIYYALEMSQNEFIARGASSLSFQQNDRKPQGAITYSDILCGKEDPAAGQWNNLPYNVYKSFVDNYMKRNQSLYIVRGDMEKTTATNICESVRAFKEMHKDEKIMLFVDYLQILSFEDGERDATELVKNAAHKFKVLSMDLKIPVFVISSIPKEENHKKMTVSSFKDSNDIAFTGGVLIGWNMDTENATDEAAAIKRANERGYRLMEFEILKSRNSEKGGVAKLYYYPAYNYITDIKSATMTIQNEKQAQKERHNINVSEQIIMEAAKEVIIMQGRNDEKEKLFVNFERICETVKNKTGKQLTAASRKTIKDILHGNNCGTVKQNKFYPTSQFCDDAAKHIKQFLNNNSIKQWFNDPESENK